MITGGRDMSNATPSPNRPVSNIHRRDSAISSSVHHLGGNQTTTTIGRYTLIYHPERYYHKVTIWVQDHVVQFCADASIAMAWAEAAQRGNWRY